MSLITHHPVSDDISWLTVDAVRAFTYTFGLRSFAGAMGCVVGWACSTYG